MAHQRGFTEKRGVHNTENGLCGTIPFKEHSTVAAAVLSVVSVLASKKTVPGPQPVAGSERCRRFPPEHNVDLVRVVSVQTTRTVLLRGRQSVKRTVTKSNGTDFCDRVAQNAQGVVKGVIKGVTRASFGRRAPLTPQLKRASARRREEKDFRGVYKIQQVAAVHLGWGEAPSLETENDIRVHSMGAT